MKPAQPHHHARRLAGLALGAALLLAALAPSTAHAQSRAQRQAAEVAGKAREAFSEERYEEAAQLLQQAFGHYPEPNFIWNQARAWELAGRPAEAEDAYLRFSRLDVAPEERTAALDRAARFQASRDLPSLLHSAQDGAELDVLRKTVQTLRAGQSAAPEVATSGGASMLELGAWGLTGLGVLALGTAGGLHLASIGTVEDFQEAARNGETNRYNAIKDTLDTRVVASQILLVSGGLLAAGGATLLYFAYFDDDVAPATSALRWTPLLSGEAAGLGLHGTF